MTFLNGVKIYWHRANELFRLPIVLILFPFFLLGYISFNLFFKPRNAMPTQDLDPSDFIDSSTPIAQEVSPSQWIYDFAGLHSKKWGEKNHDQRMETLFAAIVAYLETKWIQDKKK